MIDFFADFLGVGWQPIRDKRTVDGAAVRHLHDVSHGVLEEDEIHRRATNRLVVLAHEHLESRV